MVEEPNVETFNFDAARVNQSATPPSIEGVGRSKIVVASVAKPVVATSSSPDKGAAPATTAATDVAESDPASH